MEERNEEKIQVSESGQQLERQENQAASQSLSRNLCLQLMGLIDKVNEDGVTPSTVNASCNAAEQIHKILKLNFEMKKSGF